MRWMVGKQARAEFLNGGVKAQTKGADVLSELAHYA